MNRKFVCAAVMTLAMFSIAVAEEFTAIITKVEDGKVTFVKFNFKDFKDKDKKKADPETLPTTKDVKVVKAKFNKEEMKVEAGEAIEDGLKNDIFTKIDTTKKGKGGFGGGVFATIVTDSDNKKITEIRAFTGFGKKKKDN